MSAGEHLRAAMCDAGLDCAGVFIIADGKLHRFKAAGDRERNSWFVLFPASRSTPAAGAFGCWKRGFNRSWCEKRRESLTDTEWRTIREGWKLADDERKRMEGERYATARKAAAWILDRAKPVQSHPYLERKDVKTFGDVRENRAALVLPLRDANGELHSLQFIDADGAKKFLPGGRIDGCFFTLAEKPDGALVICEGYATGASILEATGLAVVCAMNCGNLLAVSKALREKFQEREIIIAADNDCWKSEIGNPGLDKATEAAKALHAKLAVPHFANTTTEPTDFNDLHQLEGLNHVKTQLELATTPVEPPDETFHRLAKLAPIDYDHVREEEARRLNIRVSTLDTEIVKLRPRTAPDGQALEPWDNPVDGADLLDALAAEYRKFIVLPAHADVVLALWTLHTYSWESCEYSPIIAITSPVRACGKSRVLDVLEKLAHKPFRTGNMSEPVLFRVLASRKPSVLIDEFDTIPEDRRDALANILKHGFHLSGCVHRIEGEAKKEVVEFKVFGPKALACIKLSTLDGATVSRCINIRMQRKKSELKVARLRRYDGSEWQRKCLRWTNDNREHIEPATAEMPNALDDREQDIYEPLFVLANLAGGDWPEKIRNAALALCGESADATQDAAVQLLGWIKTYFTETGTDKVTSAVLVKWLNEREDAPFSTWSNSRGIGQNDIRRHLAGFEIRPNTIRIGAQTAKGYAYAWFEDAFASYLAETPAQTGNSVTSIENTSDIPYLPPVTVTKCYQHENVGNANCGADCYPVTATNPPVQEKEFSEALLL